MFRVILKRFAFLLVFLPASLVIYYGCQYAFYLGQTESIGAWLAEAGLNNYEVTFFGFLKFTVILFEFLDKIKTTLDNLLLIIIKSISFLILSYISLWIGYHPSRRHEIKSFIYLKYTALKFYYTYNYKTPKPIKFLEYYYFIIFIFLLFILGFALIYNSYRKGEENIKENLYLIYEKNDYSFTGTVTEGEKKYKVYKIVCGNYKCIGLDLDNNRNITFLPEQYKQNFNYQKFKEQFKEKKNS
ncbi:hypothetical protein [Acinetobacter oleivorans]|uniref:hypothetical protein n=1 Tax=Acinetobacter oleivorans TaxID=1148157 RepID=UPI0030177798